MHSASDNAMDGDRVYRTLTITDIIETVRLVNAAAPYANHVLISSDEEIEPVSVSLRRHSV